MSEGSAARSTPIAEKRPAGESRRRGLTALPSAAYRLPRTAPLADPHARRRRRTAFHVAGDIVLLLLALGAALLGGTPATAGNIGWAFVYGALVLVLVGRAGGYRFRLEVSPFEYLGEVFVACLVAATAVISARVLTGGNETDAREIVRLWAFATMYLGAARVGLSIAARREDRPGLKTLIIGAGTVGHLVARRLHDHPELGLRPVGFLDKEPRDDPDDPLPVLGASWDLEDVARREGIEHVIVTFSTAPHEVLLGLVRRCRALGLEVSLVPRLFEEISNRVSVEHLGGIALLRVDQIDPRGWQFEVKYALDRVAAAIIVIAISPVLLTIAALVKLTSPGPVFYRQRRVGLDGREFDILKFRTMRVAPEDQQWNAEWAQRAIGEDVDVPVADPAKASEDRRTPIGRWLRRWSLDELPQLLNILRGEMSFIGPRPEQARYVPAFAQHVYRYGDRHRVKSGLTGWAQIHGLRGDTSLADRIEWDNFYVENWSPLLDLKILVLTLPAVLSGRAAE